MVSTARAFWVVSPGSSELRDAPLRAPGHGEVLVQTLYTALSRGTESLVFQGKVPPSEYRHMRCPHQEGDFPAPVKYGYANVGRVLEGPAALRDRAVFSLYPHQSAFVVDETAVVAVPDGVPPARAVLAANLETALNAVWDARPLPGDRVSVIGAGVVGCLCAYLLRPLPGVDLELVDPAPQRRDTAAALGVRYAAPADARPERDLIVHASGSPAGLNLALELGATDAEIVELSWYGTTAVELPLGQRFHRRRLSLRSSQVGTVSPRARRRFTTRARLALALELCADPLLDTLFEPDVAFDALPAVAPRLLAPGSGALCQRVRFP